MFSKFAYLICPRQLSIIHHCPHLCNQFTAQHVRHIVVLLHGCSVHHQLTRGRSGRWCGRLYHDGWTLLTAPQTVFLLHYLLGFALEFLQLCVEFLFKLFIAFADFLHVSKQFYTFFPVIRMFCFDIYLYRSYIILIHNIYFIYIVVIHIFSIKYIFLLKKKYIGYVILLNLTTGVVTRPYNQSYPPQASSFSSCVSRARGAVDSGDGVPYSALWPYWVCPHYGTVHQMLMSVARVSWWNVCSTLQPR